MKNILFITLLAMLSAQELFAMEDGFLWATEFPQTMFIKAFYLDERVDVEFPTLVESPTLSPEVIEERLVKVALSYGPLDTPDKILAAIRRLSELQFENDRLTSAEIGRILRVAGASIDAVDQNGAAALHLAVKERQVKTIEILIAAGANVNFICWPGYTPLRMAVYRGYADCVKILLDAGARVKELDNEHDRASFSVLYLAVLKGHAECLELLFNAGADVGVIQVGGGTLLHLACENGDSKCAQILLKKYIEDKIEVPKDLIPTLIELDVKI